MKLTWRRAALIRINAIEIGRTAAELLFAHLRREGRLLNASLQKHRLLLCLNELHETVLDLAASPQARLLILIDGVFQKCRLGIDVVDDPPVIQNFPLQRRQNERRQVARIEQAAEILPRVADEAGDRQSRIKVGFRNADCAIERPPDARRGGRPGRRISSSAGIPTATCGARYAETKQT